MTLIGFSTGALVVYTALRELARSDATTAAAQGIVYNAVLLGAPVALLPADWLAVRRVVARRLVNAYSSRDWLLSLLFRFVRALYSFALREHRLLTILLLLSCFVCCSIANLGVACAGTQAVLDVPGVENVELCDIVQSHVDYRNRLDTILQFINLDKE